MRVLVNPYSRMMAGRLRRARGLQGLGYVYSPTVYSNVYSGSRYVVGPPQVVAYAPPALPSPPVSVATPAPVRAPVAPVVDQILATVPRVVSAPPVAPPSVASVLAPSIDHATALVAQQKAQQSQQLAARQAAVVAALSVPAVPPTFTNYAVTSAAGSGMPGVPIPATAAPSAADQSAALEVSASNMTPAQRAAIVAATAPGISTQTKVLIGAIGAAALVGGALYLANRK